MDSGNKTNAAEKAARAAEVQSMFTEMLSQRTNAELKTTVGYIDPLINLEMHILHDKKRSLSALSPDQGVYKINLYNFSSF